MTPPVNPLVGLAIRRVNSESLRICVNAAHPRTEKPLAHWRITRPELDPPLPGPKHVYVCSACLAEFCSRTGATVLI